MLTRLSIKPIVAAVPEKEQEKVSGSQMFVLFVEQLVCGTPLCVSLFLIRIRSSCLFYFTTERPRSLVHGCEWTRRVLLDPSTEYADKALPGLGTRHADAVNLSGLVIFLMLVLCEKLLNSTC